MKKTLLYAVLIGFSGCTTSATKTEKDTTANNAQFDAFKNRFVSALWKANPQWATSQGFHDYDSVLILPNAASRVADLAFNNSYLDSLKQFDINQLDQNNATDFALIQNQLKQGVWSITQYKSHEWNPSNYNIGGSVAEILNNKNATLTIKVANVNGLLRNISNYYSAAKQNITTPTLEHTDLAIQQLQGTVSYLETSVNDSINAIKGNATVLKNALEATNNFIDYLQGKKAEMQKNKVAFKDFRIGKELFFAKFEYEIQAQATAEQIYNRALKRKEELNTEMATLAEHWWKNKNAHVPLPANKKEMVRQAIATISKTHVARQNFQTEIEREIPLLTAFVKQKNLLYMDPAKPLVVRKEPEWMAGVAGASISAPGPYDKNGNTYYNVGSLAAYSPEEAESYLREYNQYTLQILNIHEAIPGHYAQLIYANQSPSIIKAILGNGAMIEGWAVYTERMMMEEGWAKNTEINGTVQEDEMWLMYYKWHMRVVCNTILDYNTHVNNWTKDQALNLLMNEAYQEKAEAEGKWRRATLTQVQLCSYFTGYSEIYDLRQTLKTKQQASFNLKAFHEKLLSFGSAPIKFIAPIMNK
jgi:uncharacterized protein (DUF885 family)